MHLVLWVEGRRVDVIDSGDEAVGHVSPDDTNDVLERAEEHYAENFGR